jgi:hypothetical protein
MKLKILIFFLLCSGFVMAEAITSDEHPFETNTSNPIILGQNYPNPAKTKTVINVEFTSAEAVLNIYNVLGKLIESKVLSGDQKRVILDVSDYQEGIYLYSIEADGQKITKRMTVSK